MSFSVFSLCLPSSNPPDDDAVTEFMTTDIDRSVAVVFVAAAASNKAPYYLLRSLLFFSLLLPPDPMYCNWDPPPSLSLFLLHSCWGRFIDHASARPSAPSRQSCIFIIVVVVVTRAVELTRIIPERRKPATEILEDLTCRLSLELEI